MILGVTLGVGRSARNNAAPNSPPPPYVAATVLSTGIHPATSRMVGLHMATYSPDGEVVDTYFCVFNPGDNPGPRHLHSLTPEDIEQGVGFETQLRQICAFIDGRTLIVHNSTRDWGFIVGGIQARKCAFSTLKAHAAGDNDADSGDDDAG